MSATPVPGAPIMTEDVGPGARLAPGAAALVAHPMEAQRNAIAQTLAALGLTPLPASGAAEAAARLAPPAPGASPPLLPLGSLWVLFDEGAHTLALCARLRQIPQRIFWGVLVLGQGSEEARAALMGAGVDAYLSYPFGREDLTRLALSTAQRRAPVSVFGVLPPQLATAVDKAWMQLERADYYALLELPRDASAELLQQRFHQRSLVLHPDRHRGLKAPFPHIYDKLNELYKRLLEAYRVLSDPERRLMYDVALSLGVRRWDERVALELRELTARATHPEGQRALLEAERLRRGGAWGQARAAVRAALAREPGRAELLELDDCYAHVLRVMARDPSCAAAVAGGGPL